MDRVSLRELQESWAAAVVWGVSRQELDAEAVRRPLPCWFAVNLSGIDGCEGRIEGAHWIKRQRVEGFIGANVNHLSFEEATDIVASAAWDPRNGVPACEKHHRRFDAHRVDAANELIVWRHEVPAPVESFCLDWGLETALEDRNPTIGGGI